MYDQYEEQREHLERETIDFTIKVPIRDLIDLVADEALASDGEHSVRDIAPVEVWSYVGPAAALTALKEHGWMFAEHHVGRKWIDAALMQWDDDKFARPIAESLRIARDKITSRTPPNEFDRGVVEEPYDRLSIMGALRDEQSYETR